MKQKKYSYCRKKIKLPQPDGSTKSKDIYAHSEEELLFKIRKAQAEAEEAIERALNPTFQMVADEWEEDHEKEVGYYTMNGYKAPVKNLNEEFGNKLIKEITSLDIQRFINELGKKGYAKHTIALRKIVASLIFDYAILKDLIKTNPVTVVKIPKNAVVNKRQLPDDKDIEKVKQSVDATFGLFAYLILYTGCRRGEALALTYEDIDFEKNTIDINKVIVFENGKPKVYNRAKSKDGIRTIPLLIPLKNVLNKKKTGYIFNDKSLLLTLSQFNMLWNRYKKETNVNTEEIKKETVETVNQVKETIKNVDIKKDAKEATGFVSSMFKDPFGTIKQIVNDSTNKFFKIAIIFMSLWIVAIFIGNLFETSMTRFSFNLAFKQILSIIKAVVAPLVGLPSLSL